MKRFRNMAAFGVLILSVTALVSAQAPAGGQGRGAPPPPPANLQFFPKDIARAELLAQMQAFNQALGVGCDHCHMFQQGSPTNDMASDAKQPKKTARVMLAMTRDVNAKLAAELGKPAADITRVGCATCHRGVAIPKQLVDIVTDAAAQSNAAAAVQKYRDLRKQYYGGQSYDFTENTLITAAQRAVMANKPDDAIAYLQANIEFFPNSARSYQGLSQAYQRKNDKDNAVKSLQKAIELDPANPQYKAQLQQLN